MTGNTRKITAALAACLAAVALFGETADEKAGRMKWWTDARFGMFIHFGLYAMPAHHEWFKTYNAVSDEKYDEYFKRFDPDLFDAKAWAKAAKAAGMKYVVLTTKHHEGFCLWDSQYTDYKITKTPFGRDLVKEFVEAVRAEGLKVGFYYSLLDWHHPHYTIDRNYPGMLQKYGWGSPDKIKDWNEDALNKGRDMNVYRQYMKDQVTELLTKYGKIDILWYDFTFPDKTCAAAGKTPDDWDARGLIALTRKLQPGIIVNNRLGLKDEDTFDFITPEQFKVSAWPKYNGKETAWETCQTFSGSWGYHRDETSWKDAHQLVELLVHTVSHGGNLIMNVGPTGRGEFDARANDRLAAFGKWMHANGRAIYGCTRAPAEFKAPAGTLLTWNPATRRLYVHLVTYPMGRLETDLGDRIAYAQFLHDASEIKVTKHKPPEQDGEIAETTALDLPVVKPDVEIPVVELWIK